jgi:DNA primase
MRKSAVLYNYDNACQRPFVVLTEGPTKVWSVGPEAVAQMGDKLSSYHAMLITQRWKAAVIYLDGDAADRAEEAWYALKAVPQRVLVRLPDGQEPGDFSVEQNRDMIYRVAQQQGVTLPMESLP